ncbi:MAG: hypothetical protein U5N26_08910 [Candidatus Marinimicrobia bacterium]|nr:hypothetical protein [Candidatus Neomarinimicrobiota bacterium]
MNLPSEYRVSGMVFDEFTSFAPGDRQLIGFRDSSLYLYAVKKTASVISTEDGESIPKSIRPAC